MTHSVKRAKPIRIAYIITGWIFFGLGIAGIALPLLPGTPFLLLCSYCFFQGSPRLHQWLRSRPRLGPPIREWEDKKVIRPGAKALGVTMIVLGIGTTVVTVDVHIGVKILLVIIGLSTSTFILTRKSR